MGPSVPVCRGRSTVGEEGGYSRRQARSRLRKRRGLAFCPALSFTEGLGCRVHGFSGVASEERGFPFCEGGARATAILAVWVLQENAPPGAKTIFSLVTCSSARCRTSGTSRPSGLLSPAFLLSVLPMSPGPEDPIKSVPERFCNPQLVTSRRSQPVVRGLACGHGASWPFSRDSKGSRTATGH